MNKANASLLFFGFMDFAWHQLISPPCMLNQVPIYKT